MIDYPDDLEGQMTIFDILDEKPTDYTCDRLEKKRPAPKWYRKDRCENCEAWTTSTGSTTMWMGDIRMVYLSQAKGRSDRILRQIREEKGELKP